MKKLLAILAATAVLASATLVTTSTIAMTADANVTVTMGQVSESEVEVVHSYTVYQIFAGKAPDGSTTPGGAGDNFGFELDDVDWASNVDVKDLTTALENFKDDTGSAPFVGHDGSAAAVAAVIKAFNTTTVQAFAAYLAKNCLSYLDMVITSTDNSFTVSDDGYYLIIDNGLANNSNTDTEYSYSRSVLAVIYGASSSTETLEITAKNGLPSVEKKVKENNETIYYDASGTGDKGYVGEGYNDVADYCTGDDVPFELIGTMPENIADYEHYYYCFNDTLDENFTFNDGSVEVVINSGGILYTVDDTCYSVITGSSTDSYTFQVEFTDLLSATSNSDTISITSESLVYVYYTAKLNSGAVLGLSGQENAVDLTYSNNVNQQGDGENKPKDTGTTLKDKVIVFTYALVIQKKDTSGNALSGAQFQLQNSEGKYAVVGDDGYITDWADTGSTFESNEDGLIYIYGLDQGNYTLTETKPPEGYNELNGGISFTIDATTVNNQQWNDFTPSSALKEISLTVTGEDTEAATDTSLTASYADTCGYVGMTVINSSGAELPTTGGIGTTIFYVAGGVLVVGAGVLLISRKRSRS